MGMTKKDLENVKLFIQDAVKETVNGKIDKVQEMVREHNEKHEKDMEDMKPIIAAYANATGFTKVIAGLGVAVATLSGLWVGITQLWSALHGKM